MESDASVGWKDIDPSALEAKLNALIGDPDAAPLDSGTPDLLQQFLADPSLVKIASHSRAEGIELYLHYERVAIKPRQTRAVLHLQFLPDLLAVPRVEANLIDSSGRTRVTQATTFGARVELSQLQKSDETTIVCVEVNCSVEFRD